MRKGMDFVLFCRQKLNLFLSYLIISIFYFANQMKIFLNSVNGYFPVQFPDVFINNEQHKK